MKRSAVLPVVLLSAFVNVLVLPPTIGFQRAEAQQVTTFPPFPRDPRECEAAANRNQQTIEELRREAIRLDRMAYNLSPQEHPYRFMPLIAQRDALLAKVDQIRRWADTQRERCSEQAWAFQRQEAQRAREAQQQVQEYQREQQVQQQQRQARAQAQSLQSSQDQRARSLQQARQAGDTLYNVWNGGLRDVVSGLLDARRESTGTVDEEGRKFANDLAGKTIDQNPNEGVKKIQSKLLSKIGEMHDQTLQQTDQLGQGLQQFSADLDRSRSQAVTSYDQNWGASSKGTLVVKNYEEKWGTSAPSSTSLSPAQRQESDPQPAQVIQSYQSRWGGDDTTSTSPAPSQPARMVRDYDNTWGATAQASPQTNSPTQVVQSYDMQWGSGPTPTGAPGTNENAPGCANDPQCRKCMTVNQEYRARGVAQLVGECRLGSATPVRK